MTVILKETSIEESDEAKSGIIIDYDNQGDIVSIELLDARKRISQPTIEERLQAGESIDSPESISLTSLEVAV